ncbi:PREDICTED: F-box protein At5g07670-like isoform X1 [Lupinus angustifolius]|uniref:F-box protein At5g07670-like isoform X1 n=1 Tax=Lupinus angustifolius TaxID=3871 RepID=UPI00092F58FF|nr:PREDICTED: F-box protein At5g07670-like isoform X1 [Lupinus angustifolius]
MSFPNENPNPSLKMESEERSARWSNLSVNENKAMNEMLLAMKLNSLPSSPRSGKTLIPNLSIIDRTLLLSDELLLRILSKLPHSQTNYNSLVCKRWLYLQGRLLRSIRVFDWNFLLSGRLIHRFPNLNHVDLIYGCLISPPSSGIFLSNRVISMHVDSACSSGWCFCEDNMLPVEVIDSGLSALASGCPNLRRLHVIGASEMGLLSVAEECSTLQELELQKCSDNVLRGIAACTNLQILKLVGNVDGFYNSVVSDIGLTILAQGCKRLVKLELCGCEGSFDGIKAIGKCCQMLEELTFCDHRMDDGWLAALSYCENLKTLKFQSCKRIDSNLGLEEYLGSCPSLERLHLQKCQLRDKKIAAAMFSVCRTVREIIIHDCWGLDNNIFSFAIVCRRVKMLYLEGCSLLTTESLESVIHSWNELQSLRVVSCKNIKDSEISPALATLVTTLQDLTWRPDTKSLLPSSLVGIGIGNKGGKFFKKT